MEFYIDSSKFFVKNEEDGAFTLMNLETNQLVDFNGFYRPLLKAVDRWMDFTTFAQAMLFVSFGQKNTVGRFRNALYDLNAAGMAQLKNVPFDGRPGVRMARLEDYIAIADFCTANYNKGLSRCVARNIDYYYSGGFYTRLKNKSEQIVMKVEDGKIQAVILCGPSTRYFGGVIFELKSFAFSPEMDEAACRAAVREMIDYLAAVSPNKLRYEWLVPQQKHIVSMLKDAGFRETAYFKKELKNGLDLRLLDYVVGNI